MKNETLYILGVKVVITPFGAKVYTKDVKVFSKVVKYLKDEDIYGIKNHKES